MKNQRSNVKMTKKSKLWRYAIAGIVVVAIILAGVAGAYLHNHPMINSNQKEKVIEAADAYLIQTSNPDEILEHSAIVKKDNLGLMAVMVKYETEGKTYAECIYFEKQAFSFYEVSGAVGVKSGTITASCQEVREKKILFVRGMGLKEEKEFTVKEVGYKGKIKGKNFLDLADTSKDKSGRMSYDVE